jgi:4-amino-4-deoxy-L-arabinose transferase-like glycosyltransferase
VAASDFDIALARTALTDTLFTFLFLLALALIAISLERDSVAWALLAGVVGGISWNVKYDGWLPAGIAFVAIIAVTVVRKESFASVKRKLLLWGIVTGVTLILYLPWVIYTQERLGGYLAVEAFHRTFLNFDWPENFWRQAGSQIYFDSFLSHISFVAAFLLMLVTRERRGSLQWRPVCLVLGGMVVSTFVLGGTGTCMVLAITGLYAAWRREGILGPMLVSGISIFFELIPCYTGFARLALPLMLLLQIAAGVGMLRILEIAESSPLFIGAAESPANKGVIWAVSASALLAVMAIGARASILKKTDPWNSAEKDDLRNVVAKMAAMIPPGSVVFVQEEPDAAFYLQRAGYTTFCFMHLAGDESAPGPFHYPTTSPVYLVAGPYMQISPEWNPLPEGVRKQLVPLARFLYQPGDVRLLDDFNPEEVSQYRLNPDGRYNLLLLRLLPQQPGAGPLAAQ